MLNTVSPVPPPGCRAGSKAWTDWEAASMPQCEKEVNIKAGNSTAFPQCWFCDHSHAGIRAKFCYLSLNSLPSTTGSSKRSNSSLGGRSGLLEQGVLEVCNILMNKPVCIIQQHSEWGRTL